MIVAKGGKSLRSSLCLPAIGSDVAIRVSLPKTTLIAGDAFLGGDSNELTASMFITISRSLFVISPPCYSGEKMPYRWIGSKF
jgi:hypothetical protein